MGFSKKWGKLKSDTFTTYRFPRKDKDWAVEEVVQCVYKPRSKEREVLGVARIIRKEPKDLNKAWDKAWAYFPTSKYPISPDTITPAEAEADGFTGMHGYGDTKKMRQYFIETYGYQRCGREKINKLTLYWPVPRPDGVVK